MRFSFDLNGYRVTVDGEDVTIDNGAKYDDREAVFISRKDVRKLASELARIERMEQAGEIEGAVKLTLE